MNILSLVWRNSVRNRLRFALTCLSVTIAFYLFTGLAAVNNALTANVSDNNQHRLMTNQKISITRSLPISYQQKILSITGVSQVTYASWFAGFYRNEKQQLAMMAVDHQSYFNLYPEYQMEAEQLQQWQNNRIGLVVGRTIADKYDWKIGDKVPLSSSIWMNKRGQFSWEFEISAIFHSSESSVDEQRVFFQHAYFDQARAYGGYSASWLSTGIIPSADVNQVGQLIDGLFENSVAPTRTVTEQVFIKEQSKQFIDMAMIIKVVVLAVMFTLLLIVSNTMMQTSRERFNETAMMKALGFSSKQLISQIFAEALLIFGIGALAGVVLAMLLIDQVEGLFADFLPGIAIGNSHFILIAGMVFMASTLCSLVPAIAIKRLSISKTLGALA